MDEQNGVSAPDGAVPDDAGRTARAGVRPFSRPEAERGRPSPGGVRRPTPFLVPRQPEHPISRHAARERDESRVADRRGQSLSSAVGGWSSDESAAASAGTVPSHAATPLATSRTPSGREEREQERQRHAASVLERLAERLRRGELTTSPAVGDRGEAATLAAVLSALLDRADVHATGGPSAGEPSPRGGVEL